MPFWITAQAVTFNGKVTDEQGNPISEVSIFVNGELKTTTNHHGDYEFAALPKIKIDITFKHIAYISSIRSVEPANENTVLIVNITLFKKTEILKEVLVNRRKITADGAIKLSPKTSQKLPSPTMGVENTLMTLPGVNNNNELSSQYNVRGGNFDENLVYINGIEVYRPFLIRAGQQEGLSIINSSMVQNILFSAGGFEAKYGDRLSSALDITYRVPKKFQLTADASFLGGAITAEGISKNQKLKAIAGVRFRDNSLFINSKETETNADPTFLDLQTLLSYDLAKKWTISLLGNISVNDYLNQPKRRRTRFGTFDDPVDLIVNFQGEENNQYKTIFAALSASYQPSKGFEMKLTGSTYKTTEEERLNVLATYNLDESNQGDNSSDRLGAQLNFSDNQLDAFISNVHLSGKWKHKSHRILFGLKYQQESYADQLNEVEQIDTSGDGLSSDIAENDATTTINSIKAANDLKILRNQFFLQYSNLLRLNSLKAWYHIGGRIHHWKNDANDLLPVTNTIYSLRGQLAIKPNSKKDLLFRFKGGMYSQPPSYREMRDNDGEIIPTVDAQNSLQFSLGNEFVFDIWERPFKLTSEAYYKRSTDVNTYTIDNIRIRYDANNDADAYAYGADVRLNGEFVKGTESWLSLGFLKTQERKGQGEFIHRPTDQRFKLGLLFQDYMPNFQNVKMYLNLVYNTGLPGGTPSYVDASDYQNRLNSYKRADIGIFYEIVGASREKTKVWHQFINQFDLGFQIFNLFDVRNAITNTWVRDAFSNRFNAVPNYMTGRVFNIKLHLEI